jgi:hypothetical protein
MSQTLRQTLKDRILARVLLAPVTAVADLRRELGSEPGFEAALLALVDARLVAGYCDRVPETLRPEEHVGGLTCLGRMDW